MRHVQPLIALVLTGSLLLTSTPGLEAAFASPYGYAHELRAFSLNQEKIRMEVQALTLQSLGSRPLLEKDTFPFLSRLLVRFKNNIRPTEANRELITTAALSFLVIIGMRLLGVWHEAQPGISMACGNALLIGRATQWSLKKLLVLGRQAVGIIDGRGRQSGGWATYFGNGSGLLARVKNPKRGDLGANMNRMFWLEYARQRVLGWAQPTPESWVLHGHVRFATASRSKRKEAHPFQWMRARSRKVWSLESGRLGATDKRVLNTISHNGDFDDINALWRKMTPAERDAVERSPLMRIHGRMLSQKEVGVFLNRVFHTNNKLKGDSPKISGLIDLLHAQGQWDATARMAWILGAQTDTNVDPLSEKEISGLADLLESIFEPMAATLLAPGTQRLSEASVESRRNLESAITRRLEQDPEWSRRFAGRAGAFSELAVKAFLDFDLYTAVHEFMKRAVGSFALVTTSSLDPGRAIVTARKQPMSIGFSSLDSSIIGAFSESAALKLQPFDYRIDLSMKGETAEIGIDEKGSFINLYPELPVTDLERIDDPVKQIPQDVIEKERLIPLINNPFVDPLPKPAMDSVGQDILDMPAVAQRIRSSWDRAQTHDKGDPLGFNLQTAEDFSQFAIGMALKKAIMSHVSLHDESHALREWLVPQVERLAREARTGEISPKELAREMKKLRLDTIRWIKEHKKALNDTSEEGRPIDLLVIGYEDSLWIGQQGLEDFGRTFGKTRLLYMKPESANKILRAFKEQEMRPDFQYAVPGGVVDRHTIVLVASQSGQTFPSVNSTLQMIHKLGLEDQFGFGRDTSRPEGLGRIFALTGELDTPLGQIIGQHFTRGAPFSRRIFTNGSGRRSSEASSVAAMAAYATLTELLIYVSEDLRRVFPDETLDPLGLRLQPDDIQELKRLRDQWVDQDLPQIVGHDAQGNIIDSEIHKKIERKSWRWTFHVWDVWAGIITSASYILATVRFHFPTLGAAMGLTDGVLGLVDVTTYLFMAALGIWFFRAVTGRPIFVWLGGRKVFLADIPAVYEPLEMYFSKLFSLSFKGLGVNFFGGNPRDHFTPRYAHRAARGDLGWLGLPDARLPALASERSDSILSLKQFYGNISMGNSVETLSLGRDGVAEVLFEGHLALPTHTDVSQIQLRSSLLQSLTESRFDALSRMVTGFVFGHLWVRKVTLGGRLWNYARTQGGARIFSTASPVSGARSQLWNVLEKRGWLNRPWSARLAFLEEAIFAGLLFAAPLAIFPSGWADPMRPVLWVLNAAVFGLVFHDQNRWRNAGLSLLFHVGFLRVGSSGIENILLALVTHFLWNNILVPLWKIFPGARETSTVRPGAPITSLPVVRSLRIVRPQVTLPPSAEPGPEFEQAQVAIPRAPSIVRSIRIQRPGVINAAVAEKSAPIIEAPAAPEPVPIKRGFLRKMMIGALKLIVLGFAAWGAYELLSIIVHGISYLFSRPISNRAENSVGFGALYSAA